MKNKDIVIIGANGFQNKLILKAKDKGYVTHVFAWECGDIGEKTADYFYPISITEKEKILRKCREIDPVGICSIGSDLAVPTVNYIANKLGLTANDSVCSLVATNKYEMRRTFAENNLPTPKFVLCDKCDKKVDMDAYQFPLIVKPTDRSGSRGVCKVYNMEELENAINYAREASFNKTVIIEEFIEGQEYSVEYISYQGKHHFLALTKKITTGAPHFVEEAHYQPAILDENLLTEIKTLVAKALDALHIKFGASHAEIMINESNDIQLIEIGARMGGDYIGSDLVEISTGYDYVEMVIDIACGKRLEIVRKRKPCFGFIKFIVSEQDINDFIKIRNIFPDYIYETNISDSVHEVRSLYKNSAERDMYYILKIEDFNTFGDTVPDIMKRIFQ